MRVAILVGLLALAPVSGAMAAEQARRDRGADDMREMREALATLGAVIEAASRPASRVDDAPWLLKESLRSGVIDPQAMGAIIRWILYEKEERVAAVFADALDAIEPELAGVDGHRYGAAARSVITAFQGVLRDAEHNRRRDGESVLRDVKPAIDAAVGALQEVQERLAQPPVDGASAPKETAPPAPAPHAPEPHGPEQ